MLGLEVWLLRANRFHLLMRMHLLFHLPMRMHLLLHLPMRMHLLIFTCKCSSSSLFLLTCFPIHVCHFPTFFSHFLAHFFLFPSVPWVCEQHRGEGAWAGHPRVLRDLVSKWQRAPPLLGFCFYCSKNVAVWELVWCNVKLSSFRVIGS